MQFKYVIVWSLVFVYLIGENQTNAGKPIRKAYLIENEKALNWQKAVEYCKDLGMSLFMIENFDEFEYLKSIIKLKHDRIVPYWMGAYKADGVFKWIKSGENIKLFLWHAGEPNDNSGNEKCIHTWDNDFDWNDNDCERELSFICEQVE
ncbi:hypothetical protein DOY81_000418 [Sarcophaga bullata]|nr:hypothetical protein DOY81_000418 [Sarcophaga bullata]